MSTIDVMRKAPEALDGLCEMLDAGFYPKEHEIRSARQSSTALRAELERLEGVEPVAEVHRGVQFDNIRCLVSFETLAHGAKLYTAPTPPAAIPALTDQECAEASASHTWCTPNGKTGCDASRLARWAYALAAERAGSRVEE